MSTVQVNFGLLGPLEIRRNGQVVSGPSGKKRSMLAMLLLHPEGTVTRDRLAGELWGDFPPPSAAANLRTHVSGLRSWLGKLFHDAAESELVSTGTGWALNMTKCGEATTDVDRFEVDLAHGRKLADDGHLVDAEPLLRRAAMSCRGLPLQDVPQGARLAARAAVLTAQWLSGVEEYADVLIQLGSYEHARIVLHELVGAHPTRERAWGQLMIACYRDGDLTAVVKAYRGAREALVEELGVEPSVEFTSLYQAILRRETALEEIRPFRVVRPPVRRSVREPMTM
ncbi:BTAD domain-containing putative transcriptional regulator [Actinosynnema sp. NPDC023794]